MKKTVLVLVFAMGAVVAATAQLPLTYSAKVGLNVHDQGGMGFTAAGLAHYAFGEKWGVQSGLGLNMRGSDLSIPFSMMGITTTTTTTMTAFELQLPILSVWRFRPTENVHILLHPGISLNFGLVGSGEVVAETEAPGLPATKVTTKMDDIYQDADRFNFGFLLGAGVEYKKYYVGFNLDDNGGEFYDMQIVLGYRF